MRREFDVIVVGLGAHGSAALYQLARRDTNVLGIDRYMVGHDLGSSHGHTRITRLATGEGAFYTPLAKRSLEIWQALEVASSHRYHLYQRTGGLLIGTKDGSGSFHARSNFLGSTIFVAKRNGVAHEILSANHIRSRFPQFNVGDDEVGYFEPDAGIVFPESCIHAAVEAAQLLGADVMTGVSVHDIRQKGDCVLLMTSRGALRAKRCVLAIGPWIRRYLPAEHAHRFEIHRQVVHWFTPIAHDASFCPERFPVFMWERMSMYGFPDQDSGVKVASARFGKTTDPDRVDREVTSEEIDEMRLALANALPKLRGHHRRSSVCMYTNTSDGNFVIDLHPDMDRVLIVSACSGHGFKHSAAIGEIASKIALGEDHPSHYPYFSLSRF